MVTPHEPPLVRGNPMKEGNMQEEKRVVPAPTFDADGYPTDETLELIEKWPALDVRGLLAFIAEAWKYSTWGPTRVDYTSTLTEHLSEPGYELWYAATGGWSGNEDLIRAFMRNHVAWGMSWRGSLAGGAHYWRIREEQP